MVYNVNLSIFFLIDAFESFIRKIGDQIKYESCCPIGHEI
jgi:hypothetical protein